MRLEDRRSFLQKNVLKQPFRRGGYTLCLRIASVRVDLLSGSPLLERRAREYFREYLADGPCHAEISLEEHSPLPGTPMVWDDPDPEFDVRGDVVIQRDFAARRVDPRAGDPVVRAVAWVAPDLDDAVHNLLRWFLPRLLLPHDSLLVHAAAVVHEGRGYVFFGPSGAGKSTVASLLAGVEFRVVVVGDDSVIIQITKPGGRLEPWVHAAPLGCGYSRLAPAPISVPLAGLYRLVQDDRHAIEAVSVTEGAAALLASTLCVDCAQDAAKRLTLACQFATSGAGIKKLHFTRDAGFWQHVLKYAGTEGRHEQGGRWHVEQPNGSTAAGDG